ncbi:MAG: NUDIX hydrolase [Pseudomonadales bacterium]
MKNYDPDSVPVRPAATVMLVDDRPDLQIFMMERHADTVFAGGMWVFPGGQVDQSDHPKEFQDVSIHRTDDEASRLMGLDTGGLAYYVAAIREVFEEAGILLALGRDTHEPLDLTNKKIAARFKAHQDDINDSNRNFIEIMKEENLILDASQMHYIARWVTPVGPPRRFDARFFITRAPEWQTPIHDERELVHSKWLSPEEILDQIESGNMVLMSPTLRMVRNLARFASSDEVIEAAAANQSDERARVTPDREIVLPGEPGYESAAEDIETGWIRLRPL